MRLVRCEECGAKALSAASQCPRCTHPLDLRDTHGVAVPLAYCPECDTYYPRSRGGCKWCGTKPAAIPVSPWKVWAGVAAAVVVLGLGIWQYRVYASSRAAAEAADTAQVSPRAVAEPAPATVSPIVPPAAIPAPATHDSAGAAAADTLPGAGGRDESLQVRVTGGATATSPQSPGGGAAATAPRSRYTGPWTRAVAQEWVNVRATASRDAAVVGVVTPNTTVELGETRAGWRRVRSAGVEGWADARFFAADTVRR